MYGVSSYTVITKISLKLTHKALNSKSPIIFYINKTFLIIIMLTDVDKVLVKESPPL